ncbi:MAG: SDR family oxidoreductase [Ramlibacter sp.]|nr:SDR family oxidoreductase [Ramlibacter sp.]
MKIADTTALVTGANRGIGFELVRALRDAGAARIYATARDPSTLEHVRQLAPDRVVPLSLDVTDEDSVAALAQSARDTRLVINNAGVLDFGGILDAPLTAVDRNLRTNFYGKLLVARALAPVIEASGGGAIVNVLTLVALASMPGLSVYNASKAAAWSMTQSLRAGLAPRGIAVHAVFPGAVDTDMLAGVEMPKAGPSDVARAIVAGVNEGREDIFPDPMSQQVYAAWKQDHKAVERQFAAM